MFAAAWQLVMILATLSSQGVAGPPLMLAQAGLAAVALLALRHRIPDPVIVLGMAGIGLWCHLASGDIDSALVFAACWEISFASCIAGLLILRPYVVPLVAATAVAIAATLVLVLPEAGIRFPITTVVTQLSIIVAIRWGLDLLLRFAAETDAAAAEAEEAARRTQLVKRTSMRMAEESRVLHDTAINTLGAIAGGGAGTADAALVREQCARDVALLQLLRGEQTLPEQHELREVFEQPGLPILRSGLDDEAVARLSATLPPSAITAVVRCVREAVTNAAKHSGADHVEVELTASETVLTVGVRDAGVGFAVDAPGGLGVGISILNRARDHGFEARVTSSPGVGTSVVLSIPLRVGEPAAQAESTEDLRRSIGDLGRNAGELWGLGVTVVSIVLTLGGGTNQFFALYPMIGIMLAAWAVPRFFPAARDCLPLRAALILCTCAVFFLSAAATSFGAEGAIHWQALAATGPFVLLLSLCPDRRVPLAAAAAWILLVVCTAASSLPASTTAAQIVLLAGAVGLSFSGVWAIFQVLITRLGEEAARSRQQTFASNLAAELDAAAQTSYHRWIGAGLDSAIELLQSIAEGGRVPDDASTRRACGEEERYLRQLVQVSPELAHLNGELMPALRYARDRQVDFVLRLGTTDAPDHESARSIASVLIRNLAAMPAGETLTASLFPVDQALRLTLIGPGVSPSESMADSARHERFGSFDLLEVTYANPSASAGTPILR